MGELQKRYMISGFGERPFVSSCPRRRCSDVERTSAAVSVATRVSNMRFFLTSTLLFFFFLNFISDFIPFSPNLVANHSPISSITPPPCYLDPLHTPRPLAATVRICTRERCVSKPHPPICVTVTPGLYEAHFKVLPLPWSDEPIMSLQLEPAKLSPWQRRDSKPRLSGRSIGEPAP